nr:hypothetical protein CFP56_63975 [Quercus suber]
MRDPASIRIAQADSIYYAQMSSQLSDHRWRYSHRSTCVSVQDTFSLVDACTHLLLQFPAATRSAPQNSRWKGRDPWGCVVDDQIIHRVAINNSRAVGALEWSRRLQHMPACMSASGVIGPAPKQISSDLSRGQGLKGSRPSEARRDNTYHTFNLHRFVCYQLCLRRLRFGVVVLSFNPPFQIVCGLLALTSAVGHRWRAEKRRQVHRPS